MRFHCVRVQLGGMMAVLEHREREMTSTVYGHADARRSHAGGALRTGPHAEGGLVELSVSSPFLCSPASLRDPKGSGGVVVHLSSEILRIGVTR